MTEEFNKWWDNDLLTENNPYVDSTPAFWAWEGWCAAVMVEREACAEVCKKHADVYALLEQNPHAFGTAKPAWAACIDNRDTILARGQA